MEGRDDITKLGGFAGTRGAFATAGSSRVLAAVEVLAEDAKIGVKRGNSDLDMVRLVLEDGLVVHGANAVEETAFKGSEMEDTTDVERLLTGGGGDDRNSSCFSLNFLPLG